MLSEKVKTIVTASLLIEHKKAPYCPGVRYHNLTTTKVLSQVESHVGLEVVLLVAS